MTDNVIEIGDKVKDKVSNLEGTVVAKTDYLYGCSRIAIQYGFDRDGKPLEALSVDEPQATLLEKKVIARESFSKERVIKLGDKVMDIVSDFEGIAFGRAEFLYGCTRIAIAPKKGKDGKLIDSCWFDEPQVKVLKEKVVETGNRNTGGPCPAIPTRNLDAVRR